LSRICPDLVSDKWRNIVNDNGESIAELVEVLKLKFKEQLDGIEISLINKEVSNGMEAAGNTGLEYAHGTFIKLLDDDTLDSECIDKQVKYMENDKLPTEKGVIFYTKLISDFPCDRYGNFSWSTII
jgi:glycosyltransferase involved in cell wall biosynthesis